MGSQSGQKHAAHQALELSMVGRKGEGVEQWLKGNVNYLSLDLATMFALLAWNCSNSKLAKPTIADKMGGWNGESLGACSMPTALAYRTGRSVGKLRYFPSRPECPKTKRMLQSQPKVGNKFKPIHIQNVRNGSESSDSNHKLRAILHSFTPGMPKT